MNTFLLTWNPARWQWDDLDNVIEDIAEAGQSKRRWSCGRSKSIIEGDRVFLLRQRVEPRGVIGSGWVSRGSYEDKHWDSKLAAVGKKARFVRISFDVLLDADTEPILGRGKLDKNILGQMHWDTQASGISIPSNVATQVEKEWMQFLNTSGRSQGFGRTGIGRQPNEVDEGKYVEGAVKRVLVNAYERSAQARTQCIKHYGLNCCGCDFNFEQMFGDIGIGFIHVHHLKPLAEAGQQYELDPLQDLRPVCPNCHAMLHTRKPPYSIHELKKRRES